MTKFDKKTCYQIPKKKYIFLHLNNIKPFNSEYVSNIILISILVYVIDCTNIIFILLNYSTKDPSHRDVF